MKLIFKPEESALEEKNSVTLLISNVNTPSYIPRLHLAKEIEKIKRDPDVNPSLFGSFVEYYLKYKSLGTINHYEVRKYLRNPGRSELYKLIERSYTKENKDIMDICCLSFAHYLNTQQIISVDFFGFLHKIESKKDYYESYFENLNLKFRQCLPDCFLNYEGIIGAPDILSNKVLYEIKCREMDDIDYYRQQLFAYSSLNFLQHGRKLEKAFVINLFTGKIFAMSLCDVDENRYGDFFQTMHRKCKSL